MSQNKPNYQELFIGKFYHLSLYFEQIMYQLLFG